MRLPPILAVLAALGLAACQSAQSQKTAADPIEGTWASTDATPPFQTTFRTGSFATQLIDTGQTVISDGKYTRAPEGLSLTWTSLAANEARSATCTFADPNRITCTPSAGQKFTMTRVAPAAAA